MGRSWYLALVVILASMLAQADQFKYSYKFDDGTTISGLLDGTASGDFVTNVTNITLSINNVHYDTLTLLSFWVVVETSGEPATISFDGTLNNFWFADPAVLDANGKLVNEGGYGFALIGAAVNTPLSESGGKNLAWVRDASQIPTGGIFTNNNSWQLQAVPEPTSLALLVLGLLGMGAASRTKRA